MYWALGRRAFCHGLRSFLAPLFEEVHSEMLSNSLKRPNAYANSMKDLRGGNYTISMPVKKDAEYEPKGPHLGH